MQSKSVLDDYATEEELLVEFIDSLYARAKMHADSAGVALDAVAGPTDMMLLQGAADELVRMDGEIKSLQAEIDRFIELTKRTSKEMMAASHLLNNAAEGVFDAE